MNWLKGKLCPRADRDTEAEQADRLIDRHIENQDVRLTIGAALVRENKRAAADMLERLRKDLP